MDMELEIPIPALPDDPTAPDWSVCRDAWWASVAATYADPEAPLRITLEMRVTADSALTMAPQYGNRLGTCSIEVITGTKVDQQAWARFLQTLADAWCALSGGTLNVRPHWAKQWEGPTLSGRPMIKYLREVAYAETVRVLDQRAPSHGTSRALSRAMDAARVAHTYARKHSAPARGVGHSPELILSILVGERRAGRGDRPPRDTCLLPMNRRRVPPLRIRTSLVGQESLRSGGARCCCPGVRRS
jgi:hypothetical protein